MQTLFGHTGLVYCIRLNNDDELISGSDDKTIRFVRQQFSLNNNDEN